MSPWSPFRPQRSRSPPASARDAASQASIEGEDSTQAGPSSRPTTPPTPRLLDSPRPGHVYPGGTRYPPARAPPPSPKSAPTSTPGRTPSAASRRQTTRVRPSSSTSTMATHGSASPAPSTTATTRWRAWYWWSPRSWYRRYRARSRDGRGGARAHSPPPPSSHSLVPPSRLGRWRLQARARLRLRASQLAALPSWGRRLPTGPQAARAPRNAPAPAGMGSGFVGAGVGAGPSGGFDANGVGANGTNAGHVLGDDAGRWRPLAMLALPALTRRTVRFLVPTTLFRRGSTATPPGSGTFEDGNGEGEAGDGVEMRPTSPAMTAHTRATSADYDAFGPTLALRMKRRPRRFSV